MTFRFGDWVWLILDVHGNYTVNAMDVDGMETQSVNNYCIHLASLVYSNHITIRHESNVIWEIRLMVLLIVVLECILNLSMPTGIKQCLHHSCWIDIIYTVNIISPLFPESILALSQCTLYSNYIYQLHYQYQHNNVIRYLSWKWNIKAHHIAITDITSLWKTSQETTPRYDKTERR